MSKKTQITIPLRNFKDRRGGRVTPGVYRAITDDAEFGKTKGGDDMITLFFRVQGGEFDGTTIIDRLFPSMEKAQWRTVAFLQAAGIPTPRKDFVLDLSRFKNCVMDIEVEDGEPYPLGSDNVRSEVRSYARVAKAEQRSEVDLPAEDDDTAEDVAEDVGGDDSDLDGIDLADIEEL